MKQYYIKANNKGIISDKIEAATLRTALPKSVIEKFTLISIEDNQRIYVGYSTYIDNVFTENKDKYETEKAEKDFKRKAHKELQEIKDWFNSTDWIVNKIVIGEWSIEDSRWLRYLEERAIKRARQDEINRMLK